MWLDGEGRGVRVRPGGVFPGRLATTGAGLVLAGGEDEPDGDGDRPAAGADDGGGMIAGAGARSVGADQVLPGLLAGRGEPGEAPAVTSLRGMTEAIGSPSKPAAITVMEATNAAPVPRPISRIRRKRRPERSVNTGRPSLACDFGTNGSCPRADGPGTSRARCLVTVADRPG